MKRKLAIITTHPIQYNAPLFKMLKERNNISIKVFYTWSQLEKGEKYDPGFGKKIQWDLPLLNGYDYCFVNNISENPGSHHYKGIDNPTLLNEIQNWNADAVLIYGWSFKSHFKAMRFFYGKIPVLFRGDSTLLDEKPGLKKIIRRLFLKFIYSYVDIALYAGVANKAYFIAHGFTEKQLVFMPHAIDNKRFAASIENINAAKAIREKLKIPYNAFVVLFAGKLESKKQPDLLAKVFSKLDNENIFLIIAGSGELESNLKSTFLNKKNIKFIGFVNQIEMPALYTSCNVFVLPSKGPGETWGLAVNEAMATGKAIILSNSCGAAYDLVKENKNGFTFNPQDEETLSNSLFYLISNNEASKIMGKKSLEIIREYDFLHDCESLEKTTVALKKSLKIK